MSFSSWRGTTSVGLVLVLLPLGALAGSHPRFLIKPSDIPRLRHACGVKTPAGEARGLGRFGARSGDFNALRAHFARRVGDGALPGEIAAAAFLHVVDPEDPADRQRLSLLNDALQDPSWLVNDPLELVLALDWCWDALDPAARRDFLHAVRRRAKPLLPNDSLLQHHAFREKLVTLAAVAVADEADHPTQAWSTLRGKMLGSARAYFDSTFPTFLAWRGLAPTSPAAAAEEESDAVLALELAGLLTKTQIWTRHGPTVGRWMEHYVLPGSSYPALQHQFIRDDGSGGPLLPVVAWEGLQPVTAHLLAARTRDPAAASIADTVAAAMRDRSAGILAKLWRWVPIVFDLRDVSRCDRDRLPTARNLGGAVVFRGGHGPGATVVWVEAGQPYLRHRQHFDASHFLLRSGGYLVPGDGDDVSFEAVPSKGGLQRLGNLDEDFDYEQYFVSTIAHNCMVLYDPARVPRWHRERYAPRGGQRLIEGTCTDFDTALEAHPRLTGRQLAYGHQQSAAYLALDLAPAYDRRAVAYTREFVFALDRVLVVIDRLQTTEQRIIPTWIVNLPARPTVDGRGLSAGQRVAGADNQAGVWCCDQARLIHWSDRDGSLWLWSLLPEPRKLSVVGGPASRLVIKDGPHVGRTYVGGEPDGFERLVIPSGRHHPLNAWYRLGRPTLLGAQFGETPRWGRIEIEPAHRSGQYLFVTVLAADRAGADQPPAVKSQHAGGEIEITITVGEGELLLRAGEGGATGGTLELREPRPVRWELPGEVHADGPLPVQ